MESIKPRENNMIINQEKWNNWVEKNKDAYGKCCVDVARRVMEILDDEKEFDTHDIICRADKDVKAGGITGFMAGCVAEMITVCHSRGKEFQKKWNISHGIKEKDAEKGVVNPALVTIEVEETK